MPISEVYNMDCMEYMKGIPDKFFDLAIVDPQYGIDIMHKGGMPKHLGFKQYKRKDWDKSPPGKKYFEELFRVSKNQIIFGGNYFTTYLPPKMGWIVWDKGQHGLTMSDGELAWSSFDKALRIITLNRCTNSWLAKKYGKLPEDWPRVIKKGIDECFRVLEDYGVLIFKWNEEQITVREVLKAIGRQPLFGHTTGRHGKTMWMCFMKLPIYE